MASATECDWEETTPTVSIRTHEAADRDGNRVPATGSEVCQPNECEVHSSHLREFCKHIHKYLQCSKN